MAERFGLGRLLAKRWFDPVLAAALGAVCLVELFTAPEPARSALSAVGVVLLAAPVAARRSHPVAAALWGAAVVLTIPLLDPKFGESQPALASAVLPSILCYSCGAHASRRAGLVGVAGLAAGSQVGMGFADFPNVEILFVTLAPWWVGRQVGLRHRLASDLAARAAELEAEEDAFARLSVRRERARIAHELHDIVAHHLAVIVVQAGAGRIAPAGQSYLTRERFASIRQSADQALAEMARLIDILHADSHDAADGLAKLRVLLDEANSGGMRVRFSVPSRSLPLSSEIEESAYRVVREGLTNAIKHAPGAEVRVYLAARGDEFEIEVSDSGAVTPSPLAATGSGLGLTGMRERIQALGGTLDAGPESDGGWSLRARLPLARAAVTPAR